MNAVVPVRTSSEAAQLFKRSTSGSRLSEQLLRAAFGQPTSPAVPTGRHTHTLHVQSHHWVWWFSFEANTLVLRSETED